MNLQQSHEFGLRVVVGKIQWRALDIGPQRRGVVVQRDADQGQRFGGIRLAQRDEIGHFFQTGTAPGGPEVDEHHVPGVGDDELHQPVIAHDWQRRLGLFSPDGRRIRARDEEKRPDTEDGDQTSAVHDASSCSGGPGSNGPVRRCSCTRSSRRLTLRKDVFSSSVKRIVCQRSGGKALNSAYTPWSMARRSKGRAGSSYTATRGSRKPVSG